jgi:hypothetical protein
MAITLSTRDADNNIDLESEVFVGRVLRVERTTETRNWSDTMDYSDYRTTQCTYALVWLGTHGIAPEYINTPRPRAHWGSLRGAHEQLPDYLTDKARELEYFEQFAWVDCTNLHGDRMASKLVNPQTDAAPFISGEPLMWANFIAWESYRKAAAEKAAREAAAAAETRAAAAAKKAACDVKKSSKEALLKSAAEAQMVHCPKKGDVVTVNGFNGKVIWTGVSKYYGKYNARVGVKNAKGEVQWIDAAHWAK